MVVAAAACEGVEQPAERPQDVVESEHLLVGTYGPADADGYVRVPGGRRYHQSCVVEVPSGSRIARNEVFLNGRRIGKLPTCKYPVKHPKMKPGTNGLAPPIPEVYKAWDLSANDLNGYGFDWYNGMRSTWAVPARPESLGQTLFYWNGFTAGYFGGEVIQPVLQYGIGRNGGGPYWRLQAWWIESDLPVFSGAVCFPDDHEIVAGELDTEPGSCLGNGQCEWNVVARTDRCEAKLIIQTVNRMEVAWKGVVEAWNVNTCTAYPDDTGVSFWENYLTEPGPSPDDRNEVSTSEPWQTGLDRFCWNRADEGPRTVTFWH
jgi:hypothetical protein